MPQQDFQIKSYSPRIRVAGFYQNNGKVLFVKHRKKKKEYFLLPGGGQKFGETFVETLKREIKEELTVDCTVKDFINIGENVSPDKNKHRVQIIFSIDLNPEKLRLGEDPAVYDFVFFAPEEILKLDTRPYPMDFLLDYISVKKDVVPTYTRYPWKAE